MPKSRDTRLSGTQAALIKRCRSLKSTKTKVELSDADLAGVIGFLERDLGKPGAISVLPDGARPRQSYYETPPSMPEFAKPERAKVNLPEIFQQAAQEIEDFERVFECLCEIHKRRVKFAQIRETQPLPQIDELAPRGMLEFGLASPEATAALLRLRKHFYDIDNRAAQETAFLFMKIAAHAMGGTRHTSRTSPIRRSTGSRQRRPVDFIVGNSAYDFKCRMTEAPSRRARFHDELLFPRDCNVSGYRPVLLALHKLEGERSEQLLDAYQRYGGTAYTGEDAWRHLKDSSGPMMSMFLEHYVLGHISRISQAAEGPMDMKITIRDGYIKYSITGANGKTERVRIPRS